MKRYVKNTAKYTYYFCDGEGARSRGTNEDSIGTIDAHLSSDLLAYMLGYYLTTAYLNGMNNISDKDLHDLLIEDYCMDENDWNTEVEDNDVDRWTQNIESKDISDGSVLLYKIVKNTSDVIYQNNDLEEYVESLSDDVE